MKESFKRSAPNKEEREKIERSRTISDADFLKDGAKYIIDPDTGEKKLRLTENQIFDLQDTPIERSSGFTEEEKESVRNKINKIYESIKEQDINSGDIVEIRLVKSVNSYDGADDHWIKKGMNTLIGEVTGLNRNRISVHYDKGRSDVYVREAVQVVSMGLDCIQSIIKLD